MKLYFLYHYRQSAGSRTDVRAIHAQDFDATPTPSQQQAALEAHLKATGRTLSRRHVEISTLQFAATPSGLFPEGTSRARCAAIRKALRDLKRDRERAGVRKAA